VTDVYSLSVFRQLKVSANIKATRVYERAFVFRRHSDIGINKIFAVRFQKKKKKCETASFYSTQERIFESYEVKLQTYLLPPINVGLCRSNNILEVFPVVRKLIKFVGEFELWLEFIGKCESVNEALYILQLCCNLLSFHSLFFPQNGGNGSSVTFVLLYQTTRFQGRLVLIFTAVQTPYIISKCRFVKR
jgi:hypothetical protein